MRVELDGGAIEVIATPETRWLSALYTALRRFEVPVGSLSLVPGALTLRSGDDAPLMVRITPRAAARDAYAHTERYAIGFTGRGQLDPEHRRVLGILQRVLQRFEDVMPPGLDDYSFVGAPLGPPEARLHTLFPFATVERSERRGREETEVLARILTRCNQRCPFCSAPDVGEPAPAILVALVEACAELVPGATLTFTGGEPTLRRDLLDLATLALATPGIGRLQIQTNAQRFADRLDPAALPASERLSFFVSLHALDPTIFDACTGTRGRLDRAVAGIRRLLAADHAVTLNVVINALNRDHLLGFVDQLGATFAGLPLPSLHLSSLICQPWNERAPRHLVRYSELAELLDRVAERVRERSLPAPELLSSTHASLPLCLWSDTQRSFGHRRPRPGTHETGYEDESRPWIKARRCRACREAETCLGVPTAYARRFGLDELTPLSP